MKKLILVICFGVSAFAAQAQIITTIAGASIFTGPGSGTFSGDSGLATAADMDSPCSIAIDSNGNVFIADENNLRIRKINTSGIINTKAGISPVHGFGGDDSIATGARFCDLGYIKLGPDGNLYIPDVCNNRIRKIDGAGIITTYLGDGSLCSCGDGGLVAVAQTERPVGITFDYGGNMIFSEAYNHVRKIDVSGYVSLVAGASAIDGDSGDGGPATDAHLNLPQDIATDYLGNIYISDSRNSIIRKVDPYGIITKFAGTDTVFDYFGDGGAATNAKLYFPTGIITDGEGNVFFSDCGNNVIRRIDHATNIITTVVGNGTQGFSGDSGLATNAQLYHPAGITFDRYGNLYIADWLNNRIRKVTNVGVPLRVRGTVERGAEGVLVYPNPAGKEINISAGIGADVTITNLLGQTLIKTTMHKSIEPIDIGGLANGVYMVCVTDTATGVKTVLRVIKE